RVTPVGSDEPLLVCVDGHRLVVPRALTERYHSGAEVRGGQDRVGRHRDAIHAAVERSVGCGSQRRARLREVRTVTLDVTSVQRFEDHARGFVEPVTRLVHRYAEAAVLAARETAAHAE